MKTNGRTAGRSHPVAPSKLKYSKPLKYARGPQLGDGLVQEKRCRRRALYEGRKGKVDQGYPEMERTPCGPFRNITPKRGKLVVNEPT